VRGGEKKKILETIDCTNQKPPSIKKEETYRPPEDACRGAEVERSSCRVCVHALLHELGKSGLVSHNCVGKSDK